MRETRTLPQPSDPLPVGLHEAPDPASPESLGERLGRWSSCWHRFRAWRTPPRWSTRDWWDELRALVLAAACHALHDFDPALGQPLDPFVRNRIRARVLARYRQEWSYGLHSAPQGEIASAEDPSPTADPTTSPLAEVSDLLARLPEPDRRLLSDLILDGRTEAEVARELRISQPAVSKRKARILGRLQRALGEETGDGG
jgi:RNA polymerase sigma factor (sigma-70 family)